MNREIKFRGKRLENGEWVYGDLLHQKTLCRIVNYTDVINLMRGIFEVNHHYYDVDESTVGQFTGHTDIENKEIYDNDIVRVTTLRGIFNIVVKWSDDAMAFMACYTDKSLSPFSWFYNLHAHKLEVIGNIVDTPELLK